MTSWGAITAAPGRQLDLARPVEVYRNLRRGGYSVRQGRHVVGHAAAVMLRDVELVVSRAGWRRSTALGRRTVHAWARGWLTGSGMGTTAGEASDMPRLRYDRAAVAFVSDLEPGRPVRTAAVVAMNGRGMFAAYLGNTQIAATSPEYELT